MTKVKDKPAEMEEPPTSNSKELPGLRSALKEEFPKLADCDIVDLNFLWKTDDKIRYRLNAWVREGPYSAKIVFSKFVIAWKSSKGVQYEIR